MDTINDLYEQATATMGAALRRLARGYEADPDGRRDLLQEIHMQLWRSLRLYNGGCSLQTWVYRVAHNVAASHVMRSRRASAHLVDLDALEGEPGFVDGEAAADRQYFVARLIERIHRLKPLDRQIMLLYLEGEIGGVDRRDHRAERGECSNQDSPHPCMKTCGRHRRKNRCELRMKKRARWRTNRNDRASWCTGALGR